MSSLNFGVAERLHVDYPRAQDVLGKQVWYHITHSSILELAYSCANFLSREIHLATQTCPQRISVNGTDQKSDFEPLAEPPMV